VIYHRCFFDWLDRAVARKGAVEAFVSDGLPRHRERDPKAEAKAL